MQATVTAEIVKFMDDMKKELDVVDMANRCFMLSLFLSTVIIPSMGKNCGGNCRKINTWFHGNWRIMNGTD